MMRLLLALLLAGTAALPAAPQYTFTLHGEPVHPKILPVMSDRKGAPGPGDIGFVAEIPFVLRGPGHYQFRTFHDNGEHLFCRIDDGPEFRAGVAVAFGRRTLPEADWKRTALTIRNPPGKPMPVARPPAEASLPRFPDDLRYLSLVYPPGARIPLDSEALQGLSRLAYLSVELPAPDASIGGFGNWTELRNLSIEGGRLPDPAGLAGLAQLRFLKLRSLTGLESLDFVSKLPELRVLKVDGTAITDLRPVDGLQHLRLLSANATEAGSLPDLSRLPSLRDLRLHSTPVSKNKAVLGPLRPRLSVLVKNWEPSIRTFEAHDADHAPPENPILFIGSSSVRLWDLKKWFPEQVTLNRGFGGSELSDSLMYFDRIVLKYRPKAILLYAGDNDIGNGETAVQVIADYETFAKRVRAELPETDFAYLPIKPSLKRWEKWPEMKKANEAIRKLAEADPKLHFLDTPAPMFGDDGQLRKDVFVADGLHLNATGYELWSGIVGQWLEKL